MSRSVKQKVDRYEAKVERESKRLVTDKARSGAAGLGQQLSPGKRGTVEETAKTAESMAKKLRFTEDDELLRIEKESKIDIAEVFSRPRVTVEARKFGLEAGEAIDLATGWDLMRGGNRRRCMQWIRQNRPQVIILSPPCTAFSRLQSLNKWSAKREREFWTGSQLLKFAAAVAREQYQDGRHFIFEHPKSASSWQHKDMQALARLDGVFEVIGDQCMFGLVTKSVSGKTLPAKKRTKFLTNIPEARLELGITCDKKHEHQQLIGGRAKKAEIYPDGLCKAMCRTVIKLKERLKARLEHVFTVTPNDSELKWLMKLDKHVDDQGVVSWSAWDDVNQVRLDPEEVRKARQEEVEYIKDMGVFRLIDRSEAVKQGIKIVDARWIDTNKGDADKPNMRSRYVGREFNNSKMEGLFAATPPLEGLRYLIHRAATTGKGTRGKCIMLNDISRAFFEATASRLVCCELPPGYPGNETGDKVGVLVKSLYGTRDAAYNWVEEVARFMKGLGFIRGKYNPCLYYHPVRDIETMIHGDDFASTAEASELKWFRRKLDDRFKVKTQVVGLDCDAVCEGRILNRVIRCTEQGWEYEPDQRHAELMVKELGLEGANSVATPGERLKDSEVDDVELDAQRATQYRQITARANYLAQDRPDIMYAVKEVCRHMSKPTGSSWAKLKRLGRYLIGRERCVIRYPWQGEETLISGYTDSDWGGCQRTGLSTSGGLVRVGDHWLKSWSKTQPSITLSSAEAELVAMSKAAAEILGIVNLASDLGKRLTGHLFADSSSALAVVARRGAGKLRHININHLWLQELEKRAVDPVKFGKVDGTANPADALTKYLDQRLVQRYFEYTGHRLELGRASAGLKVSQHSARTISVG